MEVTNREVIYKSNIYFTPLTRDDEIDSEQVAYIISMEYENAGMTPDMLGIAQLREWLLDNGTTGDEMLAAGRGRSLYCGIDRKYV